MALGMGKIIPALDLKGCHGSSWYYHSKSLSMWDTGQQIRLLSLMFLFLGGGGGGGGGGVLHNMQKYHHGMTVT